LEIPQSVPYLLQSWTKTAPMWAVDRVRWSRN